MSFLTFAMAAVLLTLSWSQSGEAVLARNKPVNSPLRAAFMSADRQKTSPKCAELNRPCSPEIPCCPHIRSGHKLICRSWIRNKTKQQCVEAKLDGHPDFPETPKGQRTRREGENYDLTAIKKELAEQKKQWAEQNKQLAEQKKQSARQKSDFQRLKKDLEQQKQSTEQKSDFQRQEKKDLERKKKDLEQQKSEFVRAEEILRGIISEIMRQTKSLIKEEIATYLKTHSVCQMGNVPFHNPTISERFFSTKAIRFDEAFPKTPKAQVALRYVQWNSQFEFQFDMINSQIYNGNQSSFAAFAVVQELTPIGLKIKGGAYEGGVKIIYAAWIACL